jgi:DNA-directed RNA polymerase II subunit RPB2
MNQEDHFKIIDTYFRENTLVDHHITSCNSFYEKDIFKVFKDMNPLQYYSVIDEKTKQHKYSTNIFIGGRDANLFYYGKPVIYDDNNFHYMFPNEARLRNMTYGVCIQYDVEIILTVLEDGEEKEVIKKLPEHGHFTLGNFPIMLQSNLCILKNLPKETRYSMGECNHDYGGYFIIDGKEKVLVPQEKFSNNMIYIRTVKDNTHDFSVEIRSVSEDSSKPQRTFAIRRVKPSSTLTNGQIMVFIPNVRKSIPLFIVMRALGVLSDKDICKMIVHDIDKYSEYVTTLIPCVHDAGGIFNQMNALEYIASFTKVKTLQESYNILTNYLLPHVGEMNFKSKAYFVGHMVFEMLKVIHDDEKVTDRDSFKYKRVDTSGYLIKELFIEHATMMYEEIYKKIDKEFYYHNADYTDKGPVELNKYLYLNLFNEDRFNDKIIEDGFKKAFKGNWGGHPHTKRVGVIQPINRLSYNSFISHLRKVNLEMDSATKIVTPHLLHGSQWGMIDPIDTPDGHNIGLHKHMAIMCKITDHISVYDISKWVLDNLSNNEIVILEECSHSEINQHTKLFINGIWVGIVKNPLGFKNEFIFSRRIGLFPSYISIAFQIKSNIIYIYSDEGRLVRPILYYDNDGISYAKREKTLDNFWDDYFKGDLDLTKEFTNIDELKEDIETLKSKRGILEYLDVSETETSYITVEDKTPYEGHTHLEIHPSLLFGVLGNQIMYPEHNPCPRNVFGCGQPKQAVSLYHSNFLNRIDKMGVILNYGQKPIVKTRYLNYINEEQHPYGENAIVAIMCHTGYNVEDSILINESAVKRGLFRTTYYNMYETYEETSSVQSTSEKRIRNILNEPNIKRTKPGFDYNQLDDTGMIRPNTGVDDKTVLIGLVGYSKDTPDEVADHSIFPKKGQIGFVDRTYVTQNDEGRRIAKVRIREERQPAIGDKFASRCGQKGTIGTLIPEENMPFTKDGLRPDLIINPHALPSRMTIGQLIECVMSKLACMRGCSVDSTSFLNKNAHNKEIGVLLNSYNFHSSGNDLLYNGMTGEQIESDIFIGPTYYMRLKHMVKDKINYRAAGPRTLLTRQTNHGRANDGGLRVGEMERDGVIAHGMSSFLNDAMMKRGDEYSVAICNHTGTIAIFNKDTDNFYSPMVDGPIKYDIENANITPNIISKYGKEFSIVNIPYSFKLLIQELTAINVQMRLITSDNIDQLTISGNKNLSDIITNIDKKKRGPIKSKAEKPEIIKLKELETSMIKAKEEYEKKLNKKYKGIHPKNDPYMNNLKDLEYKTYTAYHTYKSELYKEDISIAIEQLRQLQVDYSNLVQQQATKQQLLNIEYKFNSAKVWYKELTGQESPYTLKAYLAGLFKTTIHHVDAVVADALKAKKLEESKAKEEANNESGSSSSSSATNSNSSNGSSSGSSNNNSNNDSSSSSNGNSSNGNSSNGSSSGSSNNNSNNDSSSSSNGSSSNGSSSNSESSQGGNIKVIKI